MLEEEFYKEKDGLQTEEEEKPSPNPIEEEQIDEIKLIFTTTEEGRIIHTFLLSFEGDDLIDEAIMEVNEIDPNCEQEFDNETTHGEKNVDLEAAIQEGETLLQQYFQEFNFPSELEECLDEEPTKITTFPSSPFVLQQQELAAMDKRIQGQQPAVCNMPLESKLEEFELPKTTMEEP
ncbi:hypothetical protein KI387_035565 [Taxus chinensis]|uniref:Uncharacterized protein n=1 Tax=Taxus chinensis TaxID=29808 RepID=A0AA38KQB4_TAXCH|nr:hypothetical protein KI387_035565 [Taxus chinensis]